MFQKPRALMGQGRAASRVPALHGTLCGAEDTGLLHPLGRSQDCPPLQLGQAPSSMGALGEKEGPALLPAQDLGLQPSCLAGRWQHPVPGGGGSPCGAGAAGGLSHEAVYIRKSPHPG